MELAEKSGVRSISRNMERSMVLRICTPAAFYPYETPEEM